MPLRRFMNLTAFAVMITVNALANILPINNQTTGAISDKYPSLFTPAGYVFSIWGLIYILLGTFVAYQLFPSQKNNPRFEKLGYWFAINALFNALWIVAWHYEYLLTSLFIMLVILGTLIRCYQHLGFGTQIIPNTERWAAQLAFSVYLGWISVATVANVSVVLLDAGFDGGSYASAWTAVTIAVATLLGIASVMLRRDGAYAGVLIWAFIGIAIKQNGTNTAVTISAYIAVVILALWAAAVLSQTTAKNTYL